MVIGNDRSGAKSSTELIDGREAVREVPGMYVGDVHDGTALHHLLWTVAGRAVEEHLTGRCQRADFTLRRDGGVEARFDADGSIFDHPGTSSTPDRGRSPTSASLAIATLARATSAMGSGSRG